MVYAALTAEIAGAVLAGAGYRVSADGLTVEHRDERWLARLPDGNLAWFPATPEGERRLQTERRVLHLLLTGLPEKLIAQELARSYHTIHEYVSAVFRKFGVNTQASLMERLRSASRG